MIPPGKIVTGWGDAKLNASVLDLRKLPVISAEHVFDGEKRQEETRNEKASALIYWQYRKSIFFFF